MKSNTAQKNIRKFLNSQNGRPKRVKSLVDDYGNRVHVVGGKIKHSRSLSENKKAARKKAPYYQIGELGAGRSMYEHKRTETVRHMQSVKRRNRNYRKTLYHKKRVRELRY